MNSDETLRDFRIEERWIPADAEVSPESSITR
jgi:hypothetical protein